MEELDRRRREGEEERTPWQAQEIAEGQNEMWSLAALFSSFVEAARDRHGRRHRRRGRD
jgi:hypothetical protein